MPQRPLSPHLQIYRWTLTMALSILHRATGIALYGGTLLLVMWLVALAHSEQSYLFVASLAGSWVGQVVLFGYVWALWHHIFGGLRHFLWDTGRGFDLPLVERLARLATIVPLLLTLLTWLLAESLQGGL